MYREDLIRELANDVGIRYVECDRILESLVDIIWDTLQHGEEVYIKNLGVFTFKFQKERTVNNFQTNEREVVPAKNKIVFRLSSKRKKAVEKALNEAIRRGDITYWQ
jgi:DNA-binding protein HU-beta